MALCVMAAISLPQASAAADLTEKQRFAAAMTLHATDPQQSITALKTLSQEGYARASDRLGYFSLKGLGVAQDTEAAITYYKQAIANGRDASLMSLGKVYMSDGQYRQALDTLTQASEAGHLKADAVLAWAHATGRLGPLSLQATGFDRLVVLSGTGLREAEMYLLDAAVRLHRRPANLNQVLGALHSRHAAGDTKAAEALLRYYRAQRHPRGTLKMRQTLLRTEGLRDKIRVEEGLYLARDANPARFWLLSEDLVASAPADVYARALSVTARINKNAYVRILQDELRQLGYPVGRASPYMNAPLIRAVNRFCRDSGVAAACTAGPLKSATIKAVAAELATRRGVS
jgi:tetratricopeptide (TPR) repeat protein